MSVYGTADVCDAWGTHYGRPVTRVTDHYLHTGEDVWRLADGLPMGRQGRRTLTLRTADPALKAAVAARAKCPAWAAHVAGLPEPDGQGALL